MLESISNLDIVLIAIGAVLMILGVIGSVLPVLPGPVFSYVGMLLLHFTDKFELSVPFIIITTLVIILVEVLDYVLPTFAANKFGGSKKGTIGTTIGTILSIFLFPPWGVLFLPFAGAVIGELLDEKELKEALKAGFGAFLGFVASTLAQVIVCIALAVYFVYVLFS